jgi:hypothetical protein
MPEERSVNVDSELDMKLVEFMIIDHMNASRKGQ